MTVEALWADICRNFAVWKGVGHFERKFQGERGVSHQRLWHQKSRVLGLSYGEKKLPKSSTAWVGCTNVTDRQTIDRRQTDRQTDGRLIAYSKRNVIRWRLLKMLIYACDDGRRGLQVKRSRWRGRTEDQARWPRRDLQIETSQRIRVRLCVHRQDQGLI